MLESLYRRSLLAIAASPPIKTLISKQGMKLGVKRFVAGETLEEALPALQDLMSKGLLTNLDLLGEFIDTETGAKAMTQEIAQTLRQLAATPFNRYMSIKPTQLGLGISYELAFNHALELAKLAQELEAELCLDIENYPYVAGTQRLYRELQQKGFRNVSTVLQSYLHCSMADLEALLELEPKPTLRIVKGAYRESPDVAFQDIKTIEQTFLELVYLGLKKGAKMNIATHDEALIHQTEAFIKGAAILPERYEYQLLFGVKPNLQQALVQKGHPVRIYVPFGKDWYGYFSRRLAERPANLLFVLRGLAG